jgi:hypothetical protein
MTDSNSLIRTIPVLFVTVTLAVVCALFAYDRFVVAPRLAELGASERVSLAEARDEAQQIADNLDASVDRSVEEAQVALDAQAAAVDERRAADAQRAQQELAKIRGQAQAGEVLARAAMLKTALAEYYMSMGEWPPDMAAIGLGAPDDFAGGPVARIDLEPEGVIAVRTTDAVAKGGIVRLIPQAKPTGMIEWTCRATNYPAMGAIEACRH